jgi:triosephosphate isomerase
MAGTGWKMNLGAGEARDYASTLLRLLASIDCISIDLFVLPPFTSVAAASEMLTGSAVGVGGQNMHWESEGAWTGEISAGMLTEAGCRYVELAHSERLQHFNETYERVGLKVRRALQHRLTPIVCVGETAEEKRAGMCDAVLGSQIDAAFAGITPTELPKIVLAYEPRWAIGAAEAASPDYVESRHSAIRAALGRRFGTIAAWTTRIIYGGSVSRSNGASLIAQENVDGLFAGRSAWTPEGFAHIVEIVAHATRAKERST